MAARNVRVGRGAALYYQTIRHGATQRQEAVPVEVAAPTPTIKTADQVDAEREARRLGLRMLRGLNARREGGPVDGLQFQEEQREAW